jgi:hypothetical protein
MDPTFARQFGRAVQSDILRQARQDRQQRPEPSLPSNDQGMGWVPRLIARFRLGGRMPCVEPSPMGIMHTYDGAERDCEQRGPLRGNGRAGA